MTELYWQKQRNIIKLDPLESDDPFWKAVKTDLQRKAQPKHHLQLYSMCKSDNPYIRQIKNSPNITITTVAELICRDKACQLQYCLSLMPIANENRRRKIDLKGCREQYQTMQSCIKTEFGRIIKRQQELQKVVHGQKIQQKIPIIQKQSSLISYI